MPDINVQLSHAQGFNFNKTVTVPVGFIKTLKLNGEDLGADLKPKDPEDSTSDITAVGVMTHIFWNTEVTGALSFDAQVSKANKEKIDVARFSDLMNTSIEINFAVYDYDTKANKYYTRFHDGDVVLKGSIQKDAAGNLAIDMGEEMDNEVKQPENYWFRLTMVPDAESQALHVQFSDTAKTAKQWGFEQTS